MFGDSSGGTQVVQTLLWMEHKRQTGQDPGVEVSAAISYSVRHQPLPFTDSFKFLLCWLFSRMMLSSGSLRPGLDGHDRLQYHLRNATLGGRRRHGDGRCFLPRRRGLVPAARHVRRGGVRREAADQPPAAQPARRARRAAGAAAAADDDGRRRGAAARREPALRAERAGGGGARRPARGLPEHVYGIPDRLRQGSFVGASKRLFSRQGTTSR